METSAVDGPVTEQGTDPDVERLGAPEEDPGATRWSAGPAMSASTSEPSLPDGPASPTGMPHALLLVRGERDGRGQRSRWTRSDFRLAADPDVEAGPPALQNTPALQDTNARMVADRRRRFVDEPTQPYRMPDPADFEPGPTPPELLTPPEFVSAPAREAAPPAQPAPSNDSSRIPLALAFSVDADDMQRADETPAVVPAPRTAERAPSSAAIPAADPTTMLPILSGQLPPLPKPTPPQEPTAPPAPAPVPAPRTPLASEVASAAATSVAGTAGGSQRPLLDLLRPDPDLALDVAIDPVEQNPFGGQRDYRQAVADRLPRAIRLLMPPPVPPPDSLTRTQAIESGRRRSDVELQVQAHRAGRDAIAAETRAADLSRQAAFTRDQAYEARATWQWTAHRRSTLAEELQQITTEANTVAGEQQKLSAQAQGAMRDVAAWDAWIAQLREEAANGRDAETATARADQGQTQADQLRDWLDRAEQRFRQLGAHLKTLAGERDKRVAESGEMSTRQQELVERYQRLGSDAQRLDREAAGCTAEAIGARLDCREQLIDLVGLRPELCRWVNGAAVAQVRDYEIPPGHRRPLQAEHLALEQALPGGKAPEPTPGWLTRLNGVGLRADQSRAQNCVDATLAFYDTYVLGRPRVAVPRIVDAHRSGTTRLPLRGEQAGRERLERTLNGRLEALVEQGDRTEQVRKAFDTIADRLKSKGHGAFAVLVTGWQDGNARTSAAVNHQDEVRWVDPQLGTVSDQPVPAEWVRSLEVLLVDP
ncbi:toxin glutamine deamidase domain-containing protein [Cryptosporangium sp. NPDC048952]|uniref:toxin glutamine deamidase domain-containing protein n=1 Tax=Cryptosporangium sp. NPDC048952 TaxID=3363961 RepID=UPI00371F7D7C